MQSETDDHGPKPYWSLSGLWQGVRFVLPVLPGAAVFGAAFGAVAAAKGLSFTEAVLMSAIVFAGASQLVAMEIWSSQFTPGTSFFAWSSRIATYEVLKLRERRGRDKLRFTSEFVEVIAAEAAETGENWEDRRQALAVCLAKLRPKDRELIERRYAPGNECEPWVFPETAAVLLVGGPEQEVERR